MLSVGITFIYSCSSNTYPTRCTYSQCMLRAHLHDLWTNTCGLVGAACAFGTVGHASATNCEKCEKDRRQSVRITLKELENVSAFLNRTERRYQDNHALYLLCYALLLFLILIIFNAEFTALRLHLCCLSHFCTTTTFAILTLWQ